MNSNDQATNITSDKQFLEDFLIMQNFRSINNAIKETISKPKTIDIARHILQHETCHEHKQRNNIYFLDTVEVAAKIYVDMNFKFDNEYFLKSIEKYSEGYDSGTHIVDKNQYAFEQYLEGIFIKIDQSLDTNDSKRDIFYNILDLLQK